MKSMKEIFRVEHIEKRFPGVHALKDVSFSLYENDILGLCGENGAGKSTLVKIMTGVYQPDSGEMYYMGEAVSFKTPASALKKGLSIIHQELSYLDYLTVAENIYLGRLPGKGIIVDWKKLNAMTREVFSQYNITIDPRALMTELTVAEKQIVEIVKAVSRESRIVIMDEPTSSLGMDDVEKLMNMIRAVSARGTAFVLISHRLEEVFEICNKVLVMRDGAKVNQFTKEQFSRREIIKNMVGHEMEDQYPKEFFEKGEPRLELKDISGEKVKHVSCYVRAGEIVGLYGMAGAGQDEILETIFGVRKWSGTMLLDGQKIHPQNPDGAIREGIAYVTAERRKDGLIAEHTVEENMVLAARRKLFPKGIVSYRRQQQVTEKWIRDFSIKTPDGKRVIKFLSGGNQQKVILGKWLETDPKVFCLNEPMRGVDIGVKHEIFEILQKLCKKGLGIILLSSDMLEVLGICDRIYTVCNGTITAEFDAENATQEKLLQAATQKVEVKRK